MGFIYGMHCLVGMLRKADTATGTVTIFQYGAGQAGVMRTLGKYMVASGGMFGYEVSLWRTTTKLTHARRLFMGVGSIIRTDSPPMYSPILARTLQTPIVHPRRPPPTSNR